MASFSILVTRTPFQSDAHQQALDFATAAVNNGHTIDRVFFYQDSVLCANSRIQPPQGQLSIAGRWQALATGAGFPLQLCIANAIRRGMVDEQENQRYNLAGATVLDGFELLGLGEVAEAVQSSDRLVQF